MSTQFSLMTGSASAAFRLLKASYQTVTSFMTALLSCPCTGRLRIKPIAISGNFFIVFSPSATGTASPHPANAGLRNLDEVLVRQRSSGELRELAADRQRSKINAEEADAVDQRRDLRLRRRIIAGIEQHAPSAAILRVRGQNFRAQMIERLYDTRVGHEIGDHLARHAALEVERLEQRRLDRIVGVDDDAPIPIRQAGQRGGKLGPIDRDENDLRPRRLLAFPGLDGRADVAHELRERIRVAAVGEG